MPLTRRILLIEDDAEGREALVALLDAWGHEVRVAADGLSGFDLAVAERPEVIVVDIGLPDINGVDVIRRLRAAMSRDEVRIVAYSGYHLMTDQAWEAGCDAFVLKPGVEELEALLAGDEVTQPRKAGDGGA
jgi:CheY-like chemotaxis protein